MNKRNALYVLLGCLAIGIAAAQVPPPSAESPFPSAASGGASGGGATALPSMLFGSTIAADEIYGRLKQNALFATLDKEKAGSPIIIRVSHIYGHTSAGTASALATLIFTAGTLGLLPAVSNKDLIVTYEVLVHGSTLAKYTYSKNLTRVFNIYSKDSTHGLGSDGLAWVTGTASQFASAFAADPKLAQLQNEYHFYFDQPGPSDHPGSP